jgi:hypothetical protein
MTTLHCNRLFYYAIYVYYGEMESSGHGLAEKLGLRPSTLAHLSSSSSNLPKWVPIGQMDSNFYLYVLWQDGQMDR